MAHILRLPQVDLANVLSQQIPTIDLKLHVYENSTRNFLKALTSYKSRAIGTISDRRKSQALEKKKIIDRTQAMELETNQCKLKEIELLADLERENEERKEAELSVSNFRRQLASLRDKCTAIEGEIEQYRTITHNLRHEKERERAILTTHASHVSPEIIACENRLSCSIEGVEKDQLLIRFHNLDPAESEFEPSFVIDVSNRLYRVITSTPHLPSLPVMVDTLNNGGDIYKFVKNARKGYLEMRQNI